MKKSNLRDVSIFQGIKVVTLWLETLVSERGGVSKRVCLRTKALEKGIEFGLITT